jgi:hypothetical protein
VVQPGLIMSRKLSSESRRTSTSSTSAPICSERGTTFMACLILTIDPALEHRDACGEPCPGQSGRTEKCRGSHIDCQQVPSILQRSPVHALRSHTEKSSGAVLQASPAPGSHSNTSFLAAAVAFCALFPGALSCMSCMWRCFTSVVDRPRHSALPSDREGGRPLADDESSLINSAMDCVPRCR